MKSQNYQLATKLRHELHQHPELSNEEIWTKQHLMNFLKTNTNLEIVDKGNWFYAIYRAGTDKLNIAFRAEFDALPMDEVIDLPWASQFPGRAHKCGHDGHSATLAGFALEIDQEGADKNIFFLFQPAEETGDGAIQCVDFIKEHNIDEIYAYHNMSGIPYKTVGIMDGTIMCASKGMTIHLEGAPAHASQPETGINPSFAIGNILRAIPEFTSPEKNKGLILCTVVQIDVGEKAFGIAASQGNLRMTIRALYEEELDRLQENLENFTKAQAEQFGLKVSFHYNDEFPETFNHKESSDNIRFAAKSKEMKLIELKEAFRGSEDFGHFTKLTKGAFCLIGNGEDYPHVHTYEYDFRDELIESGVELFKGLVQL
ncbi:MULTISPECIES: M20 family metallopeptidase [Lysinibacillus]|uniref:Amidohydrolase n=1 Tax=Lysinibacillus antri TaxID=2498145 RepID=A0A432LC08_9BACI|nr:MULTISPECIES: amidohydrolase [Lysinibacillus]RUL51898.1 amidohydrolase [Lysinibacillus antri]TSI09276.1 amidohydrolase [Lysinibacillus sp. BW-2-10]